MVAARKRKTVISLTLASLLLCAGCGDNAGFYLAEVIKQLNTGLVENFLNALDPKDPKKPEEPEGG